MSDLQTKYTNVLNDIEKLQTIENHIWKSSTNSDEESVQALKEIVDAKKAKYEELKSLWQASVENVETSQSNLGSTLTMNEVLKKQIDHNALYIDSLKESESNKKRMSEIGTYEYERYKEHLAVIKYLASGALIIFLTKMIMRFEWFPNILGIVIMVMTISYLVIHLASRLYYNFYRDNHDYHKFSFPVDPTLNEQKLLNKEYRANTSFDDNKSSVSTGSVGDNNAADAKIAMLESQLRQARENCAANAAPVESAND